MKANKNQIILVFLSLMFQGFLLSAQQQSVHKTTISKDKVKSNWDGVVVSHDGSNSSQGVDFFSQHSTCDSKKVTLVALSNRNNYPVKVSYRITAESPAINITIPASGFVEGSCSATDDNLAKLRISSNQNKGSLVFSDVIVTQLK